MSDTGPVHPDTFHSSSKDTVQVEGIPEPSVEDNDTMSVGEVIKAEVVTADEPQAKSGENGVSTPKKEIITDCITTPTLEEVKTPGSTKKSSAKKSSTKKPKSPSDKSPYTPKKNNSGKISYVEMIHEAIAALKDRTGSSLIAIQKLVKAKYPGKITPKPEIFKNSLNKAIKQGLKDKRFVQVKASYKINPEWTIKQKAAAKAKAAAKKKAAAKVKKDLEKAKAKSNEEETKKKDEEDKKRKEAEMTPEQKAAEAKSKAKAEILRKRRYPMEDTKLHAENKKYGIKNPENVLRRPAMPFTLTSLVPPHLRRGDNPKWGPVMNASMSGSGELTEVDNDRGLIADALHVYHFFCGDVGFEDEKYPVPKFSIKTLLYALDEIIIGNSKTAKSLPPLISHLFLTALRVLTAPMAVENESKPVDYVDPIEAQLQKDMIRIGLGLNAISWSQVLFFYIDLMERYYLSDASLDIGVMPGGDDVDMNYLCSHDNATDEVTVVKSGEEKKSSTYRGYIGNPQGAFCKAYTKLGKQVEPWNLSADELMACLRALTDDILSKRADLAADITERGLKLDELKKAKNQAMQKFRKARNDFEGPKRPTKKKSDSDESGKATEEGQTNDELREGDKKETPFKPKITKKEFLTAEKNYSKAIEAYENGIRKLISRTEPLGFDRNYNSYYCFVHDPEMMHVEQLKQTNLPPEIKRLGLALNPASSWHFIDTKALYDQFLGCLDIRGTRENELYEVSSTLSVLKRKLQDDKKDSSRVATRAREKEALEKRLENARTACDAEEGRRSGRLAGQAIDEVRKLEDELSILLEMHNEEEQLEKLGRERACDYSLLTGLQMIADLSSDRDATTLLDEVACHELWMNKKTGGNGTLQALADALLETEDMCNELSPWRRKDMTREAWRKQLSDVSISWAKECDMKLGPSPKESAKETIPKDSENETQSPTKKHRVDDRPFLANVASVLRSCIKELELRVFELSGEKMAFEEADTVEDMAGSDDEDKQDTERLQCWKRKINALKQIPTAKYVIVRDIIVAAITVARKSHLNQVAADLKVALQLHRPHAAGEAKAAALGVLEKYGGYNDAENEDDDMDIDEIAAVSGEKTGDEIEQTVSSFLCDEVTMMTGSIGGNEDADQCDWRDVLKSCKSISRLAVAAQMFLSKADDIIYRVQEEKQSLDTFLGTNNKGKSKTSKRKFDLSSPVWADCRVTDELVKGKVKNYPWWPARVCNPYDPAVAKAISDSGYTLISFVGESINYLVDRKSIKLFTDEVEQSAEKYDAETMKKLNESTCMAKSIWKRQNPGLMSPWSKKSQPRTFIEEKKSES